MNDDRRPTHVIDHPADRYARCGLKDPCPVVLAPVVAAHGDG